METKKLKTYRLSDQTLRELEALQRRYKRSAAVIIALALHAAYKGVDFDDFEEWLDLPE